MRIKGKLATAAAAATAVVVATVGIGQLANGAGAADGGAQFAPDELHALLLPTEGHPAGSVVELTFEEAASSGMLNLPQGMQVQPEVCVDYLAPVLTDQAATANGWMQADPAFSASKGLFVSWVAEVRGGAQVDQIVAHAVQCDTGHARVANYGNAEVANVEARALSLEGADTGAITQTMKFDVQDTPSSTTMHLVALGDILIMALASDPALAEQAVRHGYERALAAGLG